MLFRQQQAYKLATRRVNVTALESAQTHLLLRQHLSLDLHYFRRERIDFIAVVNRIEILKIDFEYVRCKQFYIFPKWWNSMAICVCK